MEWFNLIISILSGIAVCIPLVMELAKYIKKSIKEKNWSKLLALVMNLMAEAEKEFEDGASRKEWVIGMVMASADAIDYKINAEELGELIDSLCALSKKVNFPAKDGIGG